MNITLRNAHLVFLAVLLGVAGLTGCAVGPNYKRPTVNVPATYRGATPDGGTAVANASSTDNQPARVGAAQKPAASLADEKWWEV